MFNKVTNFRTGFRGLFIRPRPLPAVYYPDTRLYACAVFSTSVFCVDLSERALICVGQSPLFICGENCKTSGVQTYYLVNCLLTKEFHIGKISVVGWLMGIFLNMTYMPMVKVKKKKYCVSHSPSLEFICIMVFCIWETDHWTIHCSVYARHSLVLTAKQCCLIRHEQVRTTADAILPLHSQCDDTRQLCFPISGSRNCASVKHSHLAGVVPYSYCHDVDGQRWCMESACVSESLSVWFVVV
jgi:hypothetical protein